MSEQRAAGAGHSDGADAGPDFLVSMVMMMMTLSVDVSSAPVTLLKLTSVPV